jgi:hypothetical protein
VNAGKQAFMDAITDLSEYRRRWPGVLERLISARYPIDRAVQLLTASPAGIKNVVSLQ